MTIYNSSKVNNRAPTPSPAGLSDNLKVIRAVVPCTAAPTTTDTLNFFDVPANFRVVGASLQATDMDTNGSPTLTLNIGDAADPDRLFVTSNVGQTGNFTQAIANTAVNYLYTTKTRITGVAAVNAATGAAGSVTLTVWGIIEGAPS